MFFCACVYVRVCMCQIYMCVYEIHLCLLLYTYLGFVSVHIPRCIKKFGVSVGLSV